jgi:branched-chain amino acid transport system substrate-binding protein
MIKLNRREFVFTTALGAVASSVTGRAAFAQSGPVVFGAVLPLTGSSATIGEDQRRGVELAVEAINAKGGVLGQPLKVVIEDSAGRAQTALDAVKKLISVDGAKVIMGEYSSGITVPVRQAVARGGIVHVSCGSSSTKLRSDGGKTSFSVIGLDDLMAKFAANALRSRNLQKAAVIVPNNAYGESISAEFTKAFKEAGGGVVNSLLYTEGQSSYRRELQQVARYAPDVYLYSAYGQEAAIINREAFELGQKKTPWFGIYLTMCASDAPKETIEGQLGAEVNFIGPNSKWYQDAYKNKYKEDFRSAFNGYLYDAVMMSALAVNQAGTAEAAKVIEAAKALAYDGATGPIKLDADNERAAQDYLFATIKDGKVVPVTA